MTAGAAEASSTRDALDRVAAQLVGAAAPVRLDVASAEHRDAVFRLRYLVAVERGWIAAEDLPDGLEHDADDEHARFIVGWDGDELVATARLVEPQADGLLPLERAFDVRAPTARTVQLDRVTIAAAHRGDRGHRLVMAVLGRAWQEVSASGTELILGVASAPLLELYERLGIVVTPIGRARMFWGERRQAILVDLPATAARLAARSTAIG